MVTLPEPAERFGIKCKKEILIFEEISEATGYFAHQPHCDLCEPKLQ